ncbi:MAG TPA: hypothetical protein VK843_20950, partial [Planctomycetota bacterium]|nr:hypothetical protein [Planctomycetota bacterium]
LSSALKTVHERVRSATTARFDELFDQFPQLLAQGAHGARLTLNDYDHAVEPGATHALRWVTNSEGYEEGRYLEFVPRDDPSTAAIYAEQDWLFAQLAILLERG